MGAKTKIKNILKDRILILDGATGTELQKKGLPQGESPELWVLKNKKVIEDIHKGYFDAGSDIVYTCTFGANEIKLKQYGEKEVEKINEKIAQIAKNCAGEGKFVAGDIGPLGVFVSPFGSLEFEDAVNIFKRQVRGLLEGGVDLFVIETMMDIQEARAALIAVKELTDKFVIVTMTFDETGRTLGGTDPISAVVILQSLGADAVGCNCSTGPEGMLPFVMEMKTAAKVPLVVKPNAGLPKIANGKTVFDMQPEKFAEYAEVFVREGVSVIGGCCGTTPEFIRKIKKKLKGKKASAPNKSNVCFLASARKAAIFDKKYGMKIIGERINPTGKKKLKQELKNRNFSYVAKLAAEQEKAGADFLDVNAGVPGENEKELLLEMVKFLSKKTSLPLVIDSSDIDAMEAVLRIYPGRALINSITAEKKKMEKLLPLAKKYGSMFIFLPISDKGIPEKSEDRIKIVKDFIAGAKKYDIRNEDIVVDCLVMAVSSNPEAPRETLKTIEASEKKLGLKTVIGLSNVSFGLPERKWINAAFLAQAHCAGLTSAIINPSSEVMINILKAANVLMGYDNFAKNYIEYFSDVKESNFREQKREKSCEELIYDAVLEGDKNNIEEYIKKAIGKNFSPQKIVDEIMIPAITKVGELYDKRVYFLPQLIASAEAMKKGFGLLKPLLEKNTAKKRGKVILATVKGDIHDIGKNIVALMMRNYGFEVIDLGKDVSAEKIINAVKDTHARIVGLSALMTTTMINMKDVIDMAKKENLNCKFIVGGAVLTREYAQSIGANHAKDGVEAVKIASRLNED